MRKVLPGMVLGGIFLSLSACGEQRERIVDLFRWGEREAKHEIVKAPPQGGQDLDMSELTMEGLKKQGVQITEIAPGAVFVAPERQQISGIRFGLVKVENLEKVIQTVGKLEFDEKKISMVSPKIGGWVEELYVDYTGKMVRKEQPLLSIYSPDLVSAQEEFLLALRIKKIYEAQSSAEFSTQGEKLLQSARKRLLLWDLTPKQVENLEKTGEIKRNLTLYSQVDGFVMEKMVFKGMGIMPGAALYKIGDLSSIWVIADIYEYELPFIQVGQRASISLSYYPGESLEGTATYIYPAVDSKTRTVKVRFDLPNPEFRLKPEMWASVEIKIPLGRKLVVPEDAVMDTGTMQVAFVDRGQGYFEPRHIRIGSKVKGFYEVLSGLREGEKVVTSANFLIDSESRLSGALAGMGHQH